MAIAFVSVPKRGDIAVNNLTTKETKYIKREKYNAGDIAGKYEVLGSVAGILGNEAIIVHPNNGDSMKWVDRLWWYCSGYTLDGVSHTITFSLYFASNSWASATSKSVSYTATSVTELVSALNTAFAADTDFASQEWYADVFNDKVRLTCSNLAWQQPSYNSASGGLSIGSCLPEFTAHADMRRKHGGNGGEGAICNMTRAIAYYTNDNGTNSYEGFRNTVQTSVKQTYPINLPTWLGTTTKNNADEATRLSICAPLRAIYGEGKEGWLRFLKSCLPVVPTDYGDMGIHDGKSICLPIGQITGRKQSSSTSYQIASAFAKAYNLSGNTYNKGDFWLPTTEELAIVLDGDNTSNDPLNLGLSAIGGSTVHNSAYLWSCLRCNSHNAWFTHGYRGFFDYYGFYNSSRVVPVSRSIIR